MYKFKKKLKNIPIVGSGGGRSSGQRRHNNVILLKKNKIKTNNIFKLKA